MSCPVVEVGPGTVRGPGQVDPEFALTAVEFIDDPIALLDDERPEPVPRLWRKVLRSAAGPSPSTLELVCPAWWTATRVRCVTEAANDVASRIVVRRRAELLADRFGGPSRAVVEIAPEFLAVWADGATVEFVHRPDVVAEVDALGDAVAAALGTATPVLVDAPAGVVGAAALSEIIAERLRAQGHTVTVVDRDWLWDAPPAPPLGHDRFTPTGDRRGSGARVGAVIAGAAVTLIALVLAVLSPGGGGGRPAGPPDDMPVTLLVEGRIAVLVPALWRPQRITSGPGSARVQVVSHSDPRAALHLTQSPVPPEHTRQMAAEALEAALREQPAGVFVDFNPADHRAGRPAVTYREIRATHHIDWAVLVDRTVRIAIGCQHPAQEPEATRPVCEQAIRSAHAIF